MLFFPVKMKVVHIVLFLVQYNYLSLLFSLFFFLGAWFSFLLIFCLFLHRVFGAHLPAAAKDEAGQKSLCGGVCDWPGAADSRTPHSFSCGPGGCFEDRHLQSKAAWLCLLSAQQRPLVPGQHREKHKLHAAGSRGGQDTR